VLAHVFGLWKRLALGLDRIRPEPVFLASLSTAALFLPWGLRSADGGKLLFGAMHLIHGFMDTDWKTACWKMLVTSVAGMMFTAVRYRSGSLWLCVILHMALNLCMIYSNVQDAAESTVFMVERAGGAGCGLNLALNLSWSARRRPPSSSTCRPRGAAAC
jgi:hypothetical protein